MRGIHLMPEQKLFTKLLLAMLVLLAGECVAQSDTLMQTANPESATGNAAGNSSESAQPEQGHAEYSSVSDTTTNPAVLVTAEAMMVMTPGICLEVTRFIAGYCEQNPADPSCQAQ